jgi:hypothetical protein
LSSASAAVRGSISEVAMAATAGLGDGIDDKGLGSIDADITGAGATL